MKKVQIIVKMFFIFIIVIYIFLCVKYPHKEQRRSFDLMALSPLNGMGVFFCFKGFYGNDCKLVAISEENWNKSKNDYKNNLKNGIKYSIIEETLFTDGIMDNNSSELESLANEIFGNSVEIR